MYIIESFKEQLFTRRNSQKNFLNYIQTSVQTDRKRMKK